MAASKFIRFFALFYISLFVSLQVSAQKNIPFLERKVTLAVTGKNVEEVLRLIEHQNDFTFSYRAALLDKAKPLNYHCKNRPVREVLNELFQGKVVFKEKGSHIILTELAPEKSDAPAYFQVTGYFVNGENGKEIPDVSVFEKKSRVSDVSDQFGYFTLRIDKKEVGSSVALNINKRNFKDTIVYVSQSGKSYLSITLFPIEVPVTPVDSNVNAEEKMKVDQLALVNLLINKEEEVNTKNINDTIYRKFQVSFVPFLGSNQRLSGNTVNDFSLNILGGYSMATRKLEVGGLFNIDRDSVKSVQLAGLMNIDGGFVSGAQLAGIMNFNLNTTEGFQAAGLFNFNKFNFAGSQLSGLINLNLKEVKGFQAAGLLNVNLKEANGVQTAGLLNLNLHGTKGVEIAGLMNVSGGDVNGSQISGLLNFGNKVHGTQIGVLNFADSCTGVPIGFLSFVRSGYHELEISGNETFPVNVALRTGVRSFYNIVEAGMKISLDSIPTWYFGYGLGSAFNLGKKWQLNLDANVSQPLRGNELHYFNPMAKLSLTFEKRFTKVFSIAFGPTVNYFAYRFDDPTYDTVLNKLVTSSALYSNSTARYKEIGWIGGKFAVRFF
jgi:hypothetical protein